MAEPKPKHEQGTLKAFIRDIKIVTGIGRPRDVTHQGKTYDQIVNDAVTGPTKEQRDRQSTDSNN